MDSSSTSYSVVPLNASSMDYSLYPPPLAPYEEVVASPQLFSQTLEQLHAALRTKFKVPTVGGRELDLYRLFVEVTSRGGSMKVLEEKKWREVTNVFNFPASATNASYILRKYYASLLRHYEQVYFFKAKGWSRSTVDKSNASIGPVKSSPDVQPAAHIRPGDSYVKAYSPSSFVGGVVHGVIDGKFESGYLVTIKIGNDCCQGVIYEQQQQQQPYQQQPHEVYKNKFRPKPVNESSSSGLVSGTVRRKRRKKCEIKRRDPDHPKSNRSGYNFFFSEQHARLKPLYPGKDREISRMIGEAWNKLNESERSFYQEKAAKDKERYKTEMECYKQRLLGVNNSSNTVQIQQQQQQPTIQTASDFIDNNQSGKGKLGTLMINTGVYAISVQREPVMSDVNMMNIDTPVQSDQGNSFSTPLTVFDSTKNHMDTDHNNVAEKAE